MLDLSILSMKLQTGHVYTVAQAQFVYSFTDINTNISSFR